MRKLKKQKLKKKYIKSHIKNKKSKISIKIRISINYDKNKSNRGQFPNKMKSHQIQNALTLRKKSRASLPRRGRVLFHVKS